MANVTYLLGAGASCNCLPTYANFSVRFLDFKKSIENGLSEFLPHERAPLEEIISLCNTVLSEFTFHNTPDTIAKKYFHSHNGGLENLEKLKVLLVIYFMYEQCVSNDFIKNTPLLRLGKNSQLEKRYDSFIASILEPTYAQIKIDPNFSILTWNYDLQFELCFKNYYNQPLTETQLHLQCIPSNNTLTSEFKFDPNKFSIIHLNGIAYNQSEAGRDEPFSRFYTSRRELLDELIIQYKSLRANGYSLMGQGLLNFAWERDESFPHPKHALKQIIDSAKQVANKTEVLVINGYSFPIFNRAVDTILFEQMQQLKKIYIQSPIADDLRNVLLEVFAPINNRVKYGMISPITALDYFHIPHEANRKLEDPWVGI